MGQPMLRTDDLDYILPEDRIATMPAEPRDSAQLMVLRRDDPAFCEHAIVRDLPRFLRRGDLLVVNTTRVLPAFFEGWRADTAGAVEGLFLRFAGAGSEAGGELLRGRAGWVVMLQGRRMKEGVVVGLHHAGVAHPAPPAGPGQSTSTDSGVRLTLLARVPDEPGAWLVAVDAGESTAVGSSHDAMTLLERVGKTPLPPYIRKARQRHDVEVDEDYDKQRYQTIYAQTAQQAQAPSPASGVGGGGGVVGSVVGSVAAPTAGMHFTPALLEALASQGVGRAEVVLHVGTGTFKPVETTFVEQHQMHVERCWLPEATRRAIGACREAGGRVICVGTTSARTVESYAQAQAMGHRVDGWMDTNLLITPGFVWRWTDGLLTNFHLPRSTLLAMVGGLLGTPAGVGAAGEGSGQGVPRLKAAYAQALARGYRFFSYGDAMLIVP